MVLLDRTPSSATFRVSDKDGEFFEDEAGGHRWQRVPPTEKGGRVHTSTVTVAVLEEPNRIEAVPEKEVTFEFFKASGPGGQHRNKTSSACRARHEPTGTVAVCSSSRDQHRNRANAIFLLKAKVFDSKKSDLDRAIDRKRKGQIGTGRRGDKIRTYRERDNLVTDHRTGRKTQLDRLRKGDWSKLKPRWNNGNSSL